MKDIGKPCSGKLYARFDEGGQGLPTLYSTQIFSNVRPAVPVNKAVSSIPRWSRATAGETA